jgi:hypothetical protein
VYRLAVGILAGVAAKAESKVRTYQPGRGAASSCLWQGRFALFRGWMRSDTETPQPEPGRCESKFWTGLVDVGVCRW